MKTCTPTGYTARSIGDLIGFFGLILLFLIPAYLTYRFFRHQFSVSDLWLLLAPFIVGIIGRVLFECGWALAAKKKFEYDAEQRRVRWIENGQERVFPEKR